MSFLPYKVWQCAWPFCQIVFLFFWSQFLGPGPWHNNGKLTTDNQSNQQTTFPGWERTWFVSWHYWRVVFYLFCSLSENQCSPNQNSQNTSNFCFGHMQTVIRFLFACGLQNVLQKGQVRHHNQYSSKWMILEAWHQCRTTLHTLRKCWDLSRPIHFL